MNLILPRCKLRWCDWLPAFLLIVVSMFSAGCRQDMHDQAKYEPLEASTFYEDHRSARAPVEGTVARGQLRDDVHYYTGKSGGVPAVTFPMKVTDELVQRGAERFNIFCSPCHDSMGSGQGMVVRRGFKRPPSFHEERLRNAAHGYIYDVISNGFGAMSGYADQIPVRDRWAIVAYVRALQISQHSTLKEVPEEERKRLESIR